MTIFYDGFTKRVLISLLLVVNLSVRLSTNRKLLNGFGLNLNLNLGTFFLKFVNKFSF
jgi:hypothetical protein